MANASNRTVGTGLGVAGAAAGLLAAAGMVPGLAAGVTMGLAGATAGIYAAISTRRASPPLR